MSQAKRMIYIREDNLEFYNSLENKSDFINEAIKTARLGGVDNLKTTEVAETEPNEGESRQGLEVVDALEAMRIRDKKRLDEYRERNGITPPAGV